MKVGYFIIERVAEPVSNVIEQVAIRSTTFRGMCTRLSRSLNATEQRRLNRFAGFGTPKVIETPMTEEEATRKGAEYLGEGVVWTIGLGVLWHELSRDEADSQEKEKEKVVRRAEKDQKFNELILNNKRAMEDATRMAKESERRVMIRVDELEERLTELSKQTRQARNRRPLFKRITESIMGGREEAAPKTPEEGGGTGQSSSSSSSSAAAAAAAAVQVPSISPPLLD